MPCSVGGTDERIEIHAIAHPDKDQSEARAIMMERFATFDAAKAQCFLASDRERLLAVIEASFGDFTGFNRLARNVFAKRTRKISEMELEPTSRASNIPLPAIARLVLK